MPRMSGARRTEIMFGAVAYAEDRHAQGVAVVPIDEIVEFLTNREPKANDITEETVRSCLQPLEWVEMTVPGGIVDLVGAILLDEEGLRVEEGWWRRLSTMAPAEAARLYVKAAAAASLGQDDSRALRAAMTKLRRIVGEVTVVEGDEPYIVEQLRQARDRREPVFLHVEGHDLTVPTAPTRFTVIAVFRQGGEWMATVSPVSRDAASLMEALSIDAGEAITIDTSRILGVMPAPGVPDADEPSAAIIDPDPSFVVTLEYPRERDWVLDPFDTPEFTSVGDDRLRSTVVIWGRPELETLMLRLGPDAVVVDPRSMRSVGREAAEKILAVYGES